MNVLSQTLFSYYKQMSYRPSYNYPELSKQYLKVGIWNSDNVKLFDRKDIKMNSDFYRRYILGCY